MNYQFLKILAPESIVRRAASMWNGLAVEFDTNML